MTTAMTLKGLHDRLMAEMPEGASHEPCVLCAMTEDGGTTDDSKGGSVSKTYTEDEFKDALAAATSSLDTRIKELEASQMESETEAKVAAARAEMDAEIADLQRQLDEAVLEAAGQRERADSIVAWLDDEQAAQEQAAVAHARRSERIEKVKAAVTFPEEYLERNADRFAAMTDEDFEAVLESYKELASKNGNGTGGDTIPDKTALHASRETDHGRQLVGSATRDLMALRRTHGRVDFSSL